MMKCLRQCNKQQPCLALWYDESGIRSKKGRAIYFTRPDYFEVSEHWTAPQKHFNRKTVKREAYQTFVRTEDTLYVYQTKQQYY
jgi:hypothetical protein